MTRPFRTHPASRAGALAVALLASTGCATATRVPLGEDNASRLKTVRPVAALAQQELKTSIVISNAGAGFGLIGALIDSSANNSAAKGAEAKVVPVRNALIGWEAGDALRQALEREVVPVAVLHASKLEVQQLPDAKDAVARLVEATKEDALFLVQTEYRLSPAFDRMVVTAKASLLRAKLAPTDAEKAAAQEGSEPKPLYANTFVSSTALPGFVAGTTTQDDAAALWAAQQGRAARSALDGGMSELAKMIAFDIVQTRAAGPGAPEPKYEAPPEAAKLTSIGPNAQGTLSGFAVRQEKGRAWIRASTGELAAIEAP